MNTISARLIISLIAPLVGGCIQPLSATELIPPEAVIAYAQKTITRSPLPFALPLTSDPEDQFRHFAHYANLSFGYHEETLLWGDKPVSHYLPGTNEVRGLTHIINYLASWYAILLITPPPYKKKELHVIAAHYFSSLSNEFNLLLHYQWPPYLEKPHIPLIGLLSESPEHRAHQKKSAEFIDISPECDADFLSLFNTPYKHTRMQWVAATEARFEIFVFNIHWYSYLPNGLIHNYDKLNLFIKTTCHDYKVLHDDRHTTDEERLIMGEMIETLYEKILTVFCDNDYTPFLNFIPLELTITSKWHQYAMREPTSYFEEDPLPEDTEHETEPESDWESTASSISYQSSPAHGKDRLD